MRLVEFLFWMGCVVTLIITAYAQQDDEDDKKEKTAIIYGRVLDPDSKPIEGLRVYIHSHDTKLVYFERWQAYRPVYVYAEETYTDKQGKYIFEKVTITQSRNYEIIVGNPKDPEDPLKREKQILTPDKYALQNNGQCVFQDFRLEEKEYKKEVNFNLTKPAVITGKVTFEDGTPIENLIIKTTSTYGTVTETDKDGNYTIKGIKPDENGKISIVHLFPYGNDIIINTSEEQLLAWVDGRYLAIIFYDIPISEGETIVKNIIVNEIDASKIPIRYRVFVNGQLCILEDEMDIPSAIATLGYGKLRIEVKNKQMCYLYDFYPPIHGKAEIWDIPLGKYTLEINYEGSEVSTQAEIEIKENKTLELEIYVTMKDKKLEKIEIKLKE